MINDPDFQERLARAGAPVALCEVDGCTKRAWHWVGTDCFNPSLCGQHGLQHGVQMNKIDRMPNSWFGAYVIRRASAERILSVYQDAGYDGNSHVDAYLSHAIAHGCNGLVGYVVGISNSVTVHDSRAHVRVSLDSKN